jgi:hypothetical protein
VPLRYKRKFLVTFMIRETWAPVTRA